MSREQSRIERVLEDENIQDFGPLNDVLARVDKVVQNTWPARLSGKVFLPNFNNRLKRVVFDTYMRLGDDAYEMNISGLMFATVANLEDEIESTRQQRGKYGALKLEVIQQLIAEAHNVFIQSEEFNEDEVFPKND